MGRDLGRAFRRAAKVTAFICGAEQLDVVFSMPARPKARPNVSLLLETPRLRYRFTVAAYNTNGPRPLFKNLVSRFPSGKIRQSSSAIRLTGTIKPEPSFSS
jgi:hypothetical protein